MRGEDVFELERRDPLAADLDDVLGPVGDAQGAGGVAAGDVLGVQPAAFPEAFRVGVVFVVALGQPWRPHDDLADGPVVAGHLPAVLVDHLQVDQRDRRARADAQLRLLLEGQLELVDAQAGDREHRSGFRETVADRDVDAT